MLRMRISCKHGKTNFPSVQGENEMIRKTALWLVVVYHYRLEGCFAFVTLWKRKITHHDQENHSNRGVMIVLFSHKIKGKLDMSDGEVSKTIHVIEGRTPDYNSAKKAKRKTKRYQRRIVFWYVLLLLTVLPIVAMRLSGNQSAVAVYSLPMCLFACLSVYNMLKVFIYTGRTGLEQLDEKGSPFMGKMVYKFGMMRIGPFLVTVVFLIIMLITCFLYNFILEVVDVRALSSKLCK